MEKHFCICPMTKCTHHPNNHDKGCDLCVEINILDNSIPRCFFLKISDDAKVLKNHSFKSFSDFYLKHQKN
jgi:hypothetical protein